MKKLSALAFLAGLLLINSCNKVDVPQQQAAFAPAYSGDTIKKILLEDFFGHTCPQCVDADRLADSLAHAYPNQVIQMTIHEGWFAEPCPPHALPAYAPSGSFSEDFRVPFEDADYNAIFGIDNWPLPSGMINRHGAYPSQNPIYYNDWPDTITSILQDSISAYIKIHPNYDQTSRQLQLVVSGKLYDTLVGNYNVAVYLVEDNLHGWMINTHVPLPHLDSNYVFNHVFRGSVNNPGTIGGDQVLSGTHYPGTIINYSMPLTYTVSSTYNASNCKLIGILFDAATYRIVQADIVSLM